MNIFWHSNDPALRGFTLIEVLLALVIVAIALTALLKASSQNINNTARLQEKNISHWVAMQGVAMVQLGLIQPRLNLENTQKTVLLGQTWYWRVKLLPTSVKKMQQINIMVSRQPTGPFRDLLIAYRYVPHETA